jgi:alpha-beta hydrolase superfamily lysophospholipase
MQRRRAPKMALLFLGTLVLLWLVSSFLVAHRLTRRPRPPFAEPAPPVAWGRIESFRLPTADGEELGAWFVPGPDDGPSILLLHGNGDSRGCSLPLAEFFAKEGFSVLMISLRAHGDSTGAYHDVGYSARHDVLAAVAYLEQRRGDRAVFIQGVSLGAAAAIFAAKDLGTRVRGYVLECPYRDLRTAVRNRTRVYLRPPFEQLAYGGLSVVGPLVLPDLDRIAPVEAIAAVPPSVPVLLLAGSQDNRARPEDVRAIYERVASQGRLVWFEGAGHESYYARDPVLYREAIVRWLAEALAGGGERSGQRP